MDARRFFYASLGLLSLTTAYQVGVLTASADFADVNPLGIRAISGGGVSDPMVIVMDSGAVYEVQGGGPISALDETLPVPASSILAFEGSGCGCSTNTLMQTSYIVTIEGVVWRKFSSQPGSWENLGAIPGVGPVGIGTQSFGRIKGTHR